MWPPELKNSRIFSLAVIRHAAFSHEMPMEPRALPAETVGGLRPPAEGFPYFAHADRFAFEPRAESHSHVNSWWLADASFLVYGTSDFIEQAIDQSPLRKQGFQVDWLGTPADNRGMLLHNDETFVVVFRGTRLETHALLDCAEIVILCQDDFWTDSHFLPTVCEAGGRVHHGFLNAYIEINDQIDAIVQKKQDHQALWLTGHSLGGALATLAAAHLDSTHIQGIHTYGSPRVGDAGFTSVLPQRNYHRFVHHQDWVPLVPPEFLGFTHGGTMIEVTGSGSRELRDNFATGTKTLVTALQQMTREMRFDMGKLPLKIAGLADHAPVYYATLLWNGLLETEKLPPA